MRAASRIIGGLLVLAGLGFLAGLIGMFVSSGTQDTAAWFVEAFFLVAGGGLLLAGRYYLRLDADALDEEPTPQPVWRYAPYFLAHRRQLKVLAQIGLVVSLIHLGAACFGSDWPGRWVYWPLLIGLVGWVLVPGNLMNLDWNRVPKWMALTVKTAGTVVLLGGLLVVSSYWFNRRQFDLHADFPGMRLFSAGLIAFLYANAAVFFSYGALALPAEEDSAGSP